MVVDDVHAGLGKHAHERGMLKSTGCQPCILELLHQLNGNSHARSTKVVALGWTCRTCNNESSVQKPALLPCSPCVHR